MAIVSLLRLPSVREPRERWTFVFEHDQAHRRQQKRTIAYVLDPMLNEGLPGTKWHLDHQLAHRAMSGLTAPPTFGAVLQDSNLLSPRQTRWWEFLNHQEHFLHQP